MHVSHLSAADACGAPARYLRIGEHVLKVVTESDGAGALVSETFCPPGMLGVFEISPAETFPAPRPDLTVVDLVRDAEDIRALLRRPADGAVPGTYELTRGYRLPRFDGDGHTVFTLQDVNSDELAAVVRTGQRIVLIRPRSVLGDRWLTRIIRDIATRIAKADGSLVLHSSAFVFDGGAYLVVGDSGAGKSTTAIALARLLPSAGWMGNDRMHLDRREGAYDVTACPLPLAVNKGSLDVMGVTDFENWPVRAGLPRPGSDWDRFQGEDKLKLSTAEVERHLGVPVVPRARLAGVILPRVDLDADYFLEPAAPGHAAEVLGRNCFSLDDNLYGEDWLGVPVGQRTDPPALDRFLDDIATLPLLRCSVGSAADVAKLADDFPAAVRG